MYKTIICRIGDTPGMKTKLLAVAASKLLCAATAVEQPVPYPRGFRSWTHVKTAIITPAHPAFRSEGGLHHIYANQKAVQGFGTGQFPDGSAIAYELLETQEKDGVISEGEVRRVDVRVKDAARYASTGGWGFEGFVGAEQTNGVLADAVRTTCFQCHARAADKGLAFSHIR